MPGLFTASGARGTEPCKLPAYWDSASPESLTSHIPAAIYGGSCGNECFGSCATRFCRSRGRSSVGRALEWHSRGQGFDSPRLHWAGVGQVRGGSTASGLACGNSSVGRAQPCQGWGRGFESRFPLCDVVWFGAVEIEWRQSAMRSLAESIWAVSSVG